MASNDGARRSTRASSDGLGSMLQRAVAQFRELSGIEPEQVSGVRSTDDGWSFLVEAVDVERIPSTTSVLSTYRLDVDGSGELVGFERIRRYNRASVDPR